MYYREQTLTNTIHLSNEKMRLTAPSVFSDKPYHEVSSRYGFVPTIQMIDALRNEGWHPVDATQKNVRIAEKAQFTKHLVRFRQLDDDIVIGDNDSVVELLLTNSHDGTSSFSLHAGVFRMACANGIVIADSTFAKITTNHTKHVVTRIVRGAHEIIREVPKITRGIESMMDINLSEREREIFATAALTLILTESKKDDAITLTSQKNLVAQMLQPKRRADTNPDLWSTFNVIQEKALRGGLTLIKRKPGQHTSRRLKTREIKSIDKNIKLNKALWEMAELMKTLKS